MKKIISILMSILMIMSAMCIFASAASEADNTYTCVIDGCEHTVIFEESVPAEKQEMIAQKLIGIYDDSAQTYGLGCILFGHDYVYTQSSYITHKVKVYEPRCRKSTYDITYCEDCDYMEQTLVKTEYIYCCPVD